MSNKKPVYKEIIVNFFDKSLDHVIPRDYQIPNDVPKIISLLGPRRAGKTFVLFDIIKKLRRTISKERLVYLNFEDDRLFPIKLEDMDDIVQSYYELYPKNRDQKVWFFFDEIQEVPYWEKFVRRLFDQENCRIYITGSSSKLLSRELASALRGRSIPFEILPLSFKEYLRFQGMNQLSNTSKDKAMKIHHLEKFFKQGGFPELIFIAEDLHNRIINEYIDLMLYRDLAERFGIKHPQLMKYILKFLLVNLANPISVSKIFRDVKSQGYAVSKNTIYEYIGYLEEAFIIFRVGIWSKSIRKQSINPMKSYIIDQSMKYAMSMSDDKGRVLENMVFLELKRKGIHPHYFLDRQEVDFYWDNGKLINACYEFSDPDTKKREVMGLLNAMEILNIDEGEIVTWETSEVLTYDAKKINVIPLYEFLLK